MYRIGMIILVLATLNGLLYSQEHVTVQDTTKKEVKEKKVITQDKGDTIVIKVGDKDVMLSGDAEEATVTEHQEREKRSSQKEEGRVIYKEQYGGNGNEYTVIVGNEENPIVEYIEGDDTVYVRWGRKGIKIIETPDGSLIKIVRDENWPYKKKRREKFKGSWQGFEIGMNNYLTPGFGFADGFLQVYDGKAWNLNFNLLQYSINLSRSGKTGMVVGLGFRINNYKFTGNNSITKDSTGYIVSLPYDQNLKMSKLYTCYLTAPLLFEFQTGQQHKKGFRIGLGVVGGLKLRSYTKVKWYENGDKTKNKVKGDFNISPLDVAATLRIGVNWLDVYANYSLIPLFKKEQGPEVYPLAVGLGFRF